MGKTGEIDRSRCILPELPECREEDCLYWSTKLGCTRVTLRMSKSKRGARKAQAEGEKLAGDERG